MTITEQLEAHRGAMTLSSLAEMLAVSYDTVYKWVREYNLPATKIAGSYWIDPQLAARWWSDRQINKPPESVKPPKTNVQNGSRKLG